MFAVATAEDPSEAEAPVRLEVFCYRPPVREERAFEERAFEERLNGVIAELGCGVRLVLASHASARAPAGVYVSPTHPTVVVLVDGRLRASAVGDLPARELRALVQLALVR